MRRPRVYLSKKTAAAQKKLFAKLEKIRPSFLSISKEIGCAPSGLYDSKRLMRPLSPFDVVKLCKLVNGEVMPHELRPDIFGPELIELYQGYK